MLHQQIKISIYFDFQEIAPDKKRFCGRGAFFLMVAFCLHGRAKGLLCPQYGSLYMWSIKEGAYEAESITQQSVLKNKSVLSERTAR